MPAHHSIADVATLIGEPTRAAMLLALLGGRERPASDLAREASLSAAATSLHLGKLVAGGLLAVRAAGRFRYYRLASAEVGQALEASNVDMSKELVNMIVAQRTYQANAQTIKTQDEVMQVLMNMR